jgi:hypothetical protein
MHNQKQHHDGTMMWLMMAACALPVLVSAFGAGEKGVILWVLLGLGFMALLHWIIQRQSHQKEERDQ